MKKVILCLVASAFLAVLSCNEDKKSEQKSTKIMEQNSSK
ncbi:hypothetical protein EV197_2053 [Aquimarina brevivitae]|uniref:Lipoprotein n=1 Tax=Aquimarina brevivitae TaxID=323412 RepID=A0A4Q7P197_9FLAO|nr:hypothetical protein EV197_2053 [Aquimarina brevivitae]